ncbi:MAG: GNAT family N-acetyltransferase [Cyclobacteriaceae bacterium]
MMNIDVLGPSDIVGMIEMDQIADFLYEHLDQYGDEKEDIKKAIDYALNKGITPGGYIVRGREGSEIVGAVVVNRTGMQGYIPENILVYIAVNSKYRGKGYGKSLMQKAVDTAEGNIALHVEPDNPAKKLYEKLGFTNKYLEMRLSKS